MWNQPQSLFLALLAATATATATDQSHRELIVGGTPVTDQDAYPYFAYLSDINCGAALVHDDYLLTAAHCDVRSHSFHKSRVHIGHNKIYQGVERSIVDFQAHPGYLPELQDFDFALIKLNASALVDEDGKSTGLRTISLNRKAAIPRAGATLQVMGYGRYAFDNPTRDERLREVQLQYLDQNYCTEQYSPQFRKDIMFCSGVEGGGKDSCTGDSGGPVIDVNSGDLVGLASYAKGCADAEYPGVNARVSPVFRWIEEEICKGTAFPGAVCSNYDLEDPEPPESTVNITMSVLGTTDKKPTEFGWGLKYLGVNATNNHPEYLAWYPSGTYTQNLQSIDTRFEFLQPGQYDLEFGDDGNNGICCSSGRARLSLKDDLTGKIVWRSNGKFGTYVQVRLEIDVDGNIEVLYENKEFIKSYLRDVPPNSPEDVDSEWPGPMPNPNTGGFNINFKFDAFPKENVFLLAHLLNDELQLADWQAVAPQPDDQWEVLEQYMGFMDGDGKESELLTTRMLNQEAGWYLLQIQDMGGDGICCAYRRGWVTLTAAIAPDNNKGVVWGSDGEFGQGTLVYFHMNEAGAIDHVHWLYPDGTVETSDVVSYNKEEELNVNKRSLRERKLELLHPF